MTSLDMRKDHGHLCIETALHSFVNRGEVCSVMQGGLLGFGVRPQKTSKVSILETIVLVTDTKRMHLMRFS